MRRHIIVFFLFLLVILISFAIYIYLDLNKTKKNIPIILPTGENIIKGIVEKNGKTVYHAELKHISSEKIVATYDGVNMEFFFDPEDRNIVTLEVENSLVPSEQFWRGISIEKLVGMDINNFGIVIEIDSNDAEKYENQIGNSSDPKNQKFGYVSRIILNEY